MNEAITLTFAAAVPFLLLGLLMWLARLEDTLTDGLEPIAAEPAPITVAPKIEAAPAETAVA
ncbi:MAG TPA: hypothetical protein VFZ64_01605 [Nocardioidaceae bacterium]